MMTLPCITRQMKYTPIGAAQTRRMNRPPATYRAVRAPLWNGNSALSMGDAETLQRVDDGREVLHLRSRKARRRQRAHAREQGGEVVSAAAQEPCEGGASAVVGAVAGERGVVQLALRLQVGPQLHDELGLLHALLGIG